MTAPDEWGERLPRKLGLWSTIAVLVGSTIGSGIFRTPADIARHLDTVPVFALAWVAGGLVALAGALTFAELATMYPRSGGMGGSPATEHWVLEAFAADPWTGESMVHTAETTARDGGFTRAQCDQLTLLRHAQYLDALRDARAAQNRSLQPIVIEQRKGSLVLDADEGVADYSAEL